MAEFKSRLTLKTLPFFLSSSSNSTDQNKSPKSPPTRFTKQNGVVGLGIVVALNDQSSSSISSSSSTGQRQSQTTQNPVFSVSPRSDPIPIFGSKPTIQEVGIELLEEYTCVISHLGNNLIKKREYFDDGVKRKSVVVNGCLSSSYWSGGGGGGGGGVFCSPSPPVGVGVGGGVVFDEVDFLSCCCLCKKKLHGLDIFMYRGEKAFCSEECRNKEMSIDQHKEKYAAAAAAGVVKKQQPEYADTLCSSPIHHSSAGMAVA